MTCAPSPAWLRLIARRWIYPASALSPQNIGPDHWSVTAPAVSPPSSTKYSYWLATDVRRRGSSGKRSGHWNTPRLLSHAEDSPRVTMTVDTSSTPAAAISMAICKSCRIARERRCLVADSELTSGLLPPGSPAPCSASAERSSLEPSGGDRSPAGSGCCEVADDRPAGATSCLVVAWRHLFPVLRAGASPSGPLLRAGGASVIAEQAQSKPGCGHAAAWSHGGEKGARSRRS